MNKQRTLLTEERLINELLAKSPIGVQALYDKYANALFGVLVKMINNQELAEDLLQQAFIKIWYSFDTYNASKGRLFTWMIAITKNLARDCLRSKSYNQDLTTEPLAFNSDYVERHNSVTFNTDTIGIKMWVDKLKPEHKDIVNLIYYQGYTQKEVAEELKIPLGTVKMRCRAAVCLLRNSFNEPGQAVAIRG